ncbi:uncharacterized protein LOC113044180 isoform X2 [Carassius auratus]|uniref:Uncharacterized protein LOC113044180 isoform X2 n=1 Tax=Carassius auratus TaxID=7957 RepID=A0A6P6JJK0_CARAU|nr:uncharacterized protein LOC113044180 isoform X2 [Carassius auratus]
MTKPKFRPCPSCQVRQQANRKTCSACFATLPSKRLLKTAKINDDWGQRVIKNKNASRVVASAQIAVQKLSALGYMPILFISQRHKGTGKLMADVVTHLPPTQNNTRFLTSMKRAYDFMIKLDDVSQPQQDQPLDQPQQDQPLDQLIPQDHQLITLEVCPIVSQAQQHVELLPPRKRQTPPSSPGQDRQAPPSIQPQLKKRQTTGTGATQAPPSTLAKKKKTKREGSRGESALATLLFLWQSLGGHLGAGQQIRLMTNTVLLFVLYIYLNN